MAYKIKKSKEFLRNVLFVVSYIEKELGIKSAIKFQTILDSKIEKLSTTPHAGMMTAKNKAFENYLLPGTTRSFIEFIMVG
jgi:hypothetical protein